MTDRAQSEVLGYVFVFTLILLSIGTVYAMGFGELQDARHAEQMTNMERGFEVLSDNLRDLSRHGAPSRSTELALGGGTLGFGDTATISVNVTDTANTSHTNGFEVATRPLVYEGGKGTAIAYTMGAVLRSDDGYGVMVSDPRWTLTDDRVVVPYVVTYPAGSDQSVGGDVTMLVGASRETHKLQGSFHPEAGGDARVNVTVESPRAAAWADYFDEQGLTRIDGPDDGDVTYQLVTDVVYVPRTDVSVRFED